MGLPAKCTEKLAIGRILNHATREGTQVHISQIHKSGRVAQKAKLIDIDQDVGLMKLRLLGATELGANLMTQFYMSNIARAVLFKHTLSTIEPRICIPIPQQIFVHELRKNPRYYFSIQDDKVAFVWSEKFSWGLNGEQAPPPLPVVDISLTGLGLLLKKEDLEFYEKGDVVFLNSVSGENIPSDFKAEIMYIAPFKNPLSSQSDYSYRMGIDFFDSLEKLSLASGTDEKQSMIKTIFEKKFK